MAPQSPGLRGPSVPPAMTAEVQGLQRKGFFLTENVTEKVTSLKSSFLQRHRNLSPAKKPGSRC